MTDRHLDDAIDRAVHEMMNVDADSAFRARVFARLGGAAHRGVNWWRLAALSAASVAVVLAVILIRQPGALPAPPREIAAVAPKPADAPAPARPSVSGGSAETRQVASRQESARPRRRRSGAGEIAQSNPTQTVRAGALVAAVADAEPPSSDATPAAEPIAPIRITPLAAAPIAPPPIVIAPLSPIAELRIAPLSPRYQRD